MRTRFVAVLAGLTLAGTALVAPSVASASTTDGSRHCARDFHAAVVEDNEAYNAHDAARYEAILNPRMIFWQDGVATYGRDAIMATARKNFAVPGWTWTYEIESETVHGCTSGLAVASAHFIFPERDIDAKFVFTMYLVREHGKWTVASDNVHVVTA
ncbi:MAG TPA: nuclear transport factor 2 family protein [Mycobacteriales bacterium]|nr:nuclear transport factor 2 family protein [Mycobacteriales bacterium]